MNIQTKVNNFRQAIDYTEIFLRDNHNLDVKLNLDDNIIGLMIPALEDAQARNCLIMDVLDRYRPSYKLLREFINTSSVTSDTAMSNALCLYIITMIRADSMFTFYDDVAQLACQKYPENHFLRTLSDYSYTGDIDEILLGVYTGSQQHKKELGIQ